MASNVTRLEMFIPAVEMEYMYFQNVINTNERYGIHLDG
jgi:hypothetical protein